MAPRFLLLVGLLSGAGLALSACGGKDEDSDSDGVTDTDPTTSGAQATGTVSEVIPSVVFVSWTSPDAVRSWVEYGLDGAFDLSTPVSESGGTAHELTLLGLKSGQTYSYRGVAELADGTRVETEPGTVTLDPIPQDLARFSLTVPAHATSQIAGGYVMVSQIQASGDSWVVVLDSDADVVWYYQAEPNTMIVTSRPSLDGESVLFAQYDLGQKDDVGKLVRVSLDGREITETRTVLAHHDFVEHADGTLAWIGYEYHPTYKVVSDVIREIPEGATDADTPVEVYDWFDATPYDVWAVCEHMDGWASDATYDEWTHSNSLMYDADTDHYYLMSKFHDTLVKIDRSTGEIVWQMNGMYGDFLLSDGVTAPWVDVGQSQLWSHAHMSHLWDGGMVVFDNGYHYPSGEVSRAAEYVWDEDTMTVEKVWEYVEPDGKFTALMGDVRKLDGGNYLIGWSSLGRLDEVTFSQEVLWQVSLGIGAVSGRVTFMDDLYPGD